MGLEPTTLGTTIQCSNQLSYIHHIPSLWKPLFLKDGAKVSIIFDSANILEKNTLFLCVNQVFKTCRVEFIPILLGNIKNMLTFALEIRN